MTQYKKLKLHIQVELEYNRPYKMRYWFNGFRETGFIARLTVKRLGEGCDQPLPRLVARTTGGVQLKKCHLHQEVA